MLLLIVLLSVNVFMVPIVRSQSYYPDQLVTNVKFNPGVHFVDFLLHPTSIGAHQDWHWTVTAKYTGHVSLSAGSYMKVQELGTDGTDYVDYAMDTVIMTHTAATISFAEKFSTSSRKLRLYIKMAASDTATFSIYQTLIK